MQVRQIFRWIITCLLLQLWQYGASQPVPCDDRLYLITSDYVGTPSTFTQMLINRENGRPEIRILKDNMGTSLTGVGYNIFDGFIYGLHPVTYELYRVSADGNTTNLGVPENIDTTLNYLAGVCATTGRSLILVGRTKDTNVDKKLLSINLDRISAGFVSIIADWETQIEDIAIDPEYGIIMGFDKKTKRLVNIGSGGLVTSNRFEVNTPIVNVGSLFFDANSELYGFGGTGSTETIFYKFDKTNGRAKSIGNGPLGRSTDGCSCPYRVSFEKTVSPTKVLPCTEVTYRYHITNTGGTAFTQIDIRDTFPEGFVITEISELPSLGEIVSGVGSNILFLNRMHILLGDNYINVKVRVGSLPGQYPTQSKMGKFPLAIGIEHLSDDPTDGLRESPTVLTIIKGEEVIEEELVYLCPGGTRPLRANFSADQFLWNTGETSANIEVSAPGTYSVIAATPCGDFFDTIQVVNVSEPLQVDLGEDQIIEQGDEVILHPSNNGQGILLYNWLAVGDSTLSCTDCPRPTARPLVNSLYSLTITDENGCTASDELTVEVIPVRNIFAPTAFSPNGDGINDVFYLQGKTDAQILYLRVFDRWGNLVFQVQNGYLNDANFGWDGKVRGQVKESGAYVFVAKLEFADGVKKQLSGEVALLR